MVKLWKSLKLWEKVGISLLVLNIIRKVVMLLLE